MTIQALLRRARGAARRVRPALAAAFVLAPPDLVLACSVCGFGREENQLAFLVTTVVLSVLPLACIGGVVFWLWRQLRAREADERVSIRVLRSAQDGGVARDASALAPRQSL